MSEYIFVLKDFFYFFASFAFIFLALISFKLKNELSDRLAWKFLACYALVRASFFIFHLTQQFINVFPFIEHTMIFFSFFAGVFVLGFALNVTDRLGEYPALRQYWFLPVLAALTGLVLDPSKFVLYQAVFIILPALLLIARLVLAKQMFKVRVRSEWHRASGIFLCIAVFFIFVKDIGFLDRNVPVVQLFQLFLALLMSLSFWMSYRRINPRLCSKVISESHLTLEYTLVILMVLIIASGVFFSAYLANRAFETEKIQKTGLAGSLDLMMHSTFNKGDLLLDKLVQSSELHELLYTKADACKKQLNDLLGNYASVIDEAVVYILDAEGNTIASSNYKEPDSFVGKNFAFRPYFKQAMQGKKGKTLALGSVSKRYGYYTSRLLKNKQDKIFGVAVYKVDLLKNFLRFPESFPIVLLDKLQREILSNRNSDFWSNIINNDDFKFSPVDKIKNMPDTFKLEVAHLNPAIVKGRRNQFIWKFEILDFGWSFWVLDGSASLVWARLFGMALTLLGFLIASGSAAIWNISLKKAEEVEEGSRVYKTLVESSSNIIVLLDIYGNILAANSAGEKEFALSDNDALVSRLPDYWDKKSASEVRNALQHTMTGEKVVIDVSRKNAQGETTYWEMVLTPVLEGPALPGKIVGVFNDFTEKKLSTEALAHERDLTTNLLNTARVIILLLDKNGRIQRANRYFFEITGYSEQDVLGKSWIEEFVPDRERNKTSSFFKKFITTSDAESLSTQILTADGKMLNIEWKNKVTRDENRQPKGIISVGHDITRYLEVEHALRSDKSKLSMLNNCFIRFGNSPEENIDQLVEILWMLTGADWVGVKELKNGKLELLSDTAMQEELKPTQTQVCEFRPDIRKLGKTPVLVENIDEFEFKCECIKEFKSMIVSLIYFGEEIIGCQFCCFGEKVNSFPEEDLNLISIAVRAVGVEIARLRENRQLHHMIEQLAARDRRMSLEMDIARTVHRSFLPSDAPDFLPFKIGFAFQPCFSIGGDYFDFIPFPDQNQMGVLFADISGHGVAGALLSSMLKVLILSVTEKYHDPSQVLIELNKRIEENFPDGYFVSAFFALIDRNKNEVHFSSAAPEPVLLVHSDGSVKKIGKGGQPMGLLPSEFVDPEDFSTRQIKLLPGDRIIFYTDGITDIKISEQERLGLEKFCSWVSEFATMQPQKICDELYSRAKDSAIEKGIDDDMMLLVISRDEIDSSYR